PREEAHGGGIHGGAEPRDLSPARGADRRGDRAQAVGARAGQGGARFRSIHAEAPERGLPGKGEKGRGGAREEPAGVAGHDEGEAGAEPRGAAMRAWASETLMELFPDPTARRLAVRIALALAAGILAAMLVSGILVFAAWAEDAPRKIAPPQPPRPVPY